MKKSGYRTIYHIYLIFFLSMLGALIAAIVVFCLLITVRTTDGAAMRSDWPKNFTENFGTQIFFNGDQVQVGQKGIEQLQEYDIGLQILNGSGQEIFSYRKPEQAAAVYSDAALLQLGQTGGSGEEMKDILTINQLCKKVNGKTLISDLNMHVEKGQIYGFLGPNGAGKTTTMKMITNQWKPTSGEIVLFGETLFHDSYSVLKRMGSMIEFPVFYDNLTAQENLQLHCEYMGYYSPNSVEHALDILMLSNAKDKKVKEFSLGMKQRLGIARAVLTKPELLVVDEPTNGLDPSGMKQMRDLFTMLCREYEMTILISSHLLSEIESIANTVGIIQKGKLIREIAMEEITDKGLSYVEVRTSQETKASYVLCDKLHLTNLKVLNEGYIRIYGNEVTPQDIMRALTDNGIDIQAFNVQSESLEEYFLKVTGGENKCGN